MLTKLVVGLETLFNLEFNMASRFYKIGSIFSRVNGFVRKNFVNYKERPLWYDVYAKFPPKYEPKFSRPAPDIEIPEIFYTEDVIRAKVHEKFSHKLGVYNLYNEAMKTNSQSWIESYDQFIAQGMTESEALKRLEDLIESPLQNLDFDYNTYTETELSSPITPHPEIISKVKDYKIHSPPVIKTISKSDVVDESLSEDVNVNETIEVSSPVIPMAKTVPKVDEKNKDSD